MIAVKNLVKRYGSHVAVDHLSFRVEDGQIYGFLGANGAGKSTTMNIMTGYIGATEGEVLIDGHDILSEPEEAKKCIGYLPELPPLYMDMKVDEYLNFVSELKKIDKKQEKRICEKVHGNDRTAPGVRTSDPQSFQRISAACRTGPGDHGNAQDHHPG